MIRFFLFDLDGTLFDTNEANYTAYKESFSQFGIKFSREQLNQATGKGFSDLVQIVNPHLNPNERDRLKMVKSECYRKNLHLVVPNLKMINLLKAISKIYETALVTTASRDNATAVLKYFQLNPYFTTTVFGEDVQEYKPNPQCYKIAMKNLNALPSECLAFEDSPSGIQAAQNAKIEVIQI